LNAISIALISLWHIGIRNRKTAETALNEHSSRSHGLMTVYIDCEIIDPDDQRVVRKKGKICFVDLAGSEKVKESKATGETLTEALNINKSLLTLGMLKLKNIHACCSFTFIRH
jgi:hypothetical protein